MFLISTEHFNDVISCLVKDLRSWTLVLAFEATSDEQDSTIYALHFSRSHIMEITNLEQACTGKL